MVVVPLLLLAGLAGAVPPVLLDRQGALAHARERAEAGALLEAAETALLAGDPDQSLRWLAAFEPKEPGDDARKLRIEVDAHFSRGEPNSPQVEALRAIDGWKSHVRRLGAQTQRSQARTTRTRLGLILYALCLAFLLLYASRELLRVHRESAVMAAAATIAVLIMSLRSPALANASGLAALATVALVHATTASVRRLRPGPRWRLFLLTLLVLGTAGVWVAVLSRVEPARLSSSLL